MKEFTINDKNEGQRLDKYLKKIMAACPTSVLYKSFRKKNITVNDKKCQGNELLKEGDLIKIFFSDETFDKFKSSAYESSQTRSASLDNLSGSKNRADGQAKSKKANTSYRLKDLIIYEDEDFIFINKPAGLLTQKADKDDISLNELLRDYCKEKGYASFGEYRPSCVNRIDRNTSGIVMCAKTYKGSRILSDAIADHRLKKEYMALCHGCMEADITLNGYHVKDDKSNVSKVYKSLELVPKHQLELAKEIKTIIKPVKNNGLVSLVCVELITGKSHQIRTHLASIDHPLCGDIKYNGRPYKGRKYQLLHSYRLTFPVDERLGSISGKAIEAKLPNVYRI